MRELPQGWELVPLRTLIELNPKTIAVEDCTEVGFVPMTLLGKRWFDVPGFELRQWASVKKGYTHFQDGDVLLAKITPCFENGKAGLIRGLPNGIGSGSTEYFVCRTSAGTLDSRYLLAYLKTDDFMHTGAMSMTGSVGHKRVPKEYLLGREIPLAPQREQIRIANQLDTLLTRIQACNDRFDAIPVLLKRFRQTVLTEATSRTLSDADDAASSVVWTETTIGAISIDLRYGTSKKCEYSTQGTGVLRIPNIANRGRIDATDLKRAKFDSNELEKLALREGDLLVIRSNGSVELVGKTGRVSADEAGLLFAGYLMRLRVDLEKALPAFIQICLSAPMQRQYIERTAKSTSGVNNLNAAELRAVPLLLPTLSKQIEIVRRVEALLALADRIEARCTAARDQAQRLTPLVLAKAFRGELVPQNPNDEPAIALMARIASSKTAVTEKNKRKMPVAQRIKPLAAINL